MNDGKVSKHYAGSECFENLKIKEGDVAVQGAGNEIKLSCFVLSLSSSYIYTAKVWFFFSFLPKALTAHGTIFKDLSHSQKY